MRKRIMALFTAIVMIAMLVPTSFATGVASDFKQILYANFESGLDGFVTNYADDGTAKADVHQDTTTDASNYAYGKTMYYKSVDGQYGVATLSFADKKIDWGTDEGLKALGANAYAELNIDIKASVVTGDANRTIYLNILGGASPAKSQQITIYPQQKFFKIGYPDNPNGATKFTMDETLNGKWANLRVVIQLTDANGAASYSIKKVYLDAAEVLSDGSTIPTCKYTSISGIGLGSQSTNPAEAYIDNISIVTYNSADGTCPAPDRFAFRTNIDTYETQYDGHITNGVSESDLTDVKAAIDEAKVLYNSSSLTQAQCTTAISKIAAAISTFESLPYTTEYFENFNGKTEIPAEITTTTATASLENFGNPTVKTAYKLSNTIGGNAWPGTTVLFPEKVAFTDNNTYVEMEFDIKQFNMPAANAVTVNIRNGSYVAATVVGLKIDSDGTVNLNYFNDTNISAIAKVKAEEWNRIKIVMRKLIEGENTKQQITGIYINGEEILMDDTNNQPYEYSTDVNADYTIQPAIARIGFSLGNNSSDCDYNFGAYIDNVSVRTYTSSDGTSPVSDKTSTIVAIREFYATQTAIESAPDKRGYSDADRETLANAITELCAYSEKSVLTDEDSAKIEEIISTVSAMIEANKIRIVFDEGFEDSTNIFNASTQANTNSATGNAALLENSDLSYSPASAVGVTDDLSKLIAWEFDVMVENPASGSVKLALQSAGQDVEAIEIADSAITMTYNGSFRGASAEAGKWYRIRIVTSAKETASGNIAIIEEFNINGNDHLVTSTITRSLGDKTQIDSINISAEGAKAYVDNVSLKMYYTDTEAPINKGALIDHIRRGKAALAKAKIGVNMLQSIYDNYAAAVTAAEVVYNNETATQDAVYTATDTLCTAASKYIFKEESVKIGAVEFTDASGNAVVAAANGVYIDKINITRKAAYGDGSILIAVYNNGVLEQIKVLKDVIGTLTVGERTALEVDMLLGDFTYIKAFAFDSLGKLSPIAMPYSPTNEAADVYVAGDSIVQSYIDTESKSYYPRQGWGYYLQDYFEDVTVDNLAVSGYTTVSYISNGKLNIAEETMNEGDYLLVSFMANDNNKMTASQFKNMLRYYNDVAELHGATAVFITSPKTAYEHQGEFNGFCTAMRDVASELDVALIDVYDKREKFEEETSLAYVQSSMYLFNLEENFDMTESQIQANLGSDVLNGKDKTHLSEWGAERVASWIAELLQDTDSTLRYYKNNKVYTEPDAYVPSAG